MIVCLANHKGGVGKTAIAAHLMFYAADHGLRVCGIDLDAQANLSGVFVPLDSIIDAPASHGLFEPMEQPSPAPLRTNTPNVWLIPASKTLDSVENIRDSMAVDDARDRIRKLGQEFDVVVIDTKPSLGVRMEAAIAASDRVITPAIPEKFSLDGLDDLYRLIERVRFRKNPSLPPARMVWNLVTPNAGSHSYVLEQLAPHYPNALGPLHRHIAVADALMEQRPVWQGSRNAKAATDWRNVCATLLELKAR